MAPPLSPDLLVLIADADADMRRYLRACLRLIGLTKVCEATEGAEALRLARLKPVGLIICDRVVPATDGRGLCRAMKDDPELAAIPFLRVADEGHRSTCADGLLEKPFNTARLQARIEQLLGRPDAP